MPLGQPLAGGSHSYTISSAEQQRLLTEWNSTSVRYDDVSVTDLISSRASKSPRATALQLDGMKISYSELDDKTSRLANYLLNFVNVGRGSVVGLLLERSFDMIVGVLGVLKAGAAYLPLDPEYPSERLSYMLSNSGCDTVLTHKMTDRAQLRHVSRRVPLDTDWHLIERESSEAPPNTGVADSLAYVIYTSGSTGTPKGVMIPHRALTNHMLWMRDAFPLQQDDVLLQKTPLSFDASVWEILAPLICGAKLLLAKPNGHKDPAYLSETVKANAVTTLQLVPSMLRLFLMEPTAGQCHSLRNVFSGGETLTTEIRNLFFERLTANLHNLYGPTETCIQAIVYSCNRSECANSGTVPIGRPISNTQAYVLDDDLRPVPIGTEGELYIGGAGLAHGYCGRDDLTRERFIDNPFASPRARLYRTGDRVRYLADGNIEFIGRADGQLKLRGYRVELGEIEMSLNMHPSVREAALAVVDDAVGGKKLIAHVVPTSEQSIDTSMLTDYLSARLPEFMVPWQIISAPGLPRLPSGKLDRAALSNIAVPVGAGAARPSEALSATEAAMAQVWEDVLETAGIAADDDFFDLGGSSLQLLYVFSRVNKELGTSVNIEVVSRGATLRSIASFFDQALAR